MTSVAQGFSLEVGSIQTLSEWSLEREAGFWSPERFRKSAGPRLVHASGLTSQVNCERPPRCNSVITMAAAFRDIQRRSRGFVQAFNNKQGDDHGHSRRFQVSFRTSRASASIIYTSSLAVLLFSNSQPAALPYHAALYAVVFSTLTLLLGLSTASCSAVPTDRRGW